jgi:hypothetical protein
VSRQQHRGMRETRGAGARTAAWWERTAGTPQAWLDLGEQYSFFREYIHVIIREGFFHQPCLLRRL